MADFLDLKDKIMQVNLMISINWIHTQMTVQVTDQIIIHYFHSLKTDLNKPE